jgi:HEAT repeat protein
MYSCRVRAHGTVRPGAGAVMAAAIALLAAAAGGLGAAPPGASSTGAEGPAPAPSRAEVEARLQRGTRGLDPAEAAAIAHDAAGLLMRIADDRAAAPILRTRAMSALAYAGVPAAHDFLENFLIRTLPSRDATDRSLLRKAAVALGWQAGGRAVEILAQVLDHPDPEVRLDAALALGLTRAQAAVKPLRAQLAHETDAGVRAQLESQIKLLAPPVRSSAPAAAPAARATP